MTSLYDLRNLSQDKAVRVNAALEYRAGLRLARKRLAWIWIRNRVAAFTLFAAIMLAASSGGLLFGHWAETTLGRIIYFIICVVLGFFVFWLVLTHPSLNRIANKWGNEEQHLRSHIDSMKNNIRSLSRELDASNE